MTGPLERLRRGAFQLEDLLFDVRANIHTRGMIVQDQLHTDSPNKLHATAYHAVWCRNLRKLIMTARTLGYELGSFVDIGCGKGKACFYASRFGFSRVVGVDFDPRLVEAAEANKAAFRYPAEAIEFLVGDAADYLVPEDGALVFMFNPFDASVMERFLERNAARLRASGSVVAYANDGQLAVLAGAGMVALFREPARKISLWRFPE